MTKSTPLHARLVVEIFFEEYKSFGKEKREEKERGKHMVYIRGTQHSPNMASKKKKKKGCKITPNLPIFMHLGKLFWTAWHLYGQHFLASNSISRPQTPFLGLGREMEFFWYKVTSILTKPGLFLVLGKNSKILDLCSRFFPFFGWGFLPFFGLSELYPHCSGVISRKWTSS